MRLARGLVAAAAIAGCGSPFGAAKAPEVKTGPLTDRLDGTGLLAAPANRAHAAGAGLLSVAASDVGSEGDRVGSFVAIAAGECVLVLARATPSVADLDLYVYEDDGSVFASDESPEPEGNLLLCPPHPTRVYVAARVVGGQGVVAIGVQPVPVDAATAVAKAVGVRSRTGADGTALEGWSGLEAKVRAHRATLGGRWEDVRRISVPVEPHAPTRVSTGIEAHRCFDVFVTPGDEVGALDVALEDADGRVIGRAIEIGRDRALVVCSEEARDVTVALRPHSSQGLAVVVLGRSPVGSEPEITGASLLVRATQSLDVEAARKSLANRLGTNRPARVIGSGQARPGIRSSFAVDLPAGCSRVDVIAGRPLAGLDGQLWSDKAELLAESRGGAGATLFACGKGGSARVDVEALENAGPFVVDLRPEANAAPVLLAHPVAAARLLGRLESASPGQGSVAAAAPAAVVAVASESLASVPLSVAPNGCVEVVAALDTGGSGLDLRIVDAGSHEGSVTRARSVVSDVLCTGASAKTGVIELRLGAGKTDALVLTRRIEGR